MSDSGQLPQHGRLSGPAVHVAAHGSVLGFKSALEILNDFFEQGAEQTALLFALGPTSDEASPASESRSSPRGLEDGRDTRTERRTEVRAREAQTHQAR